MKNAFIRMVSILAVLVIAAVLPLAACSDGTPSQNASGATSPAVTMYPNPWGGKFDWQPGQPFAQKIRRRNSGSSVTETITETIEAEGTATTTVRKVNVRSKPSVYADKVANIRAAGTEVTVTARAKNSSGETWYEVRLSSGTAGYIRADLLNTENVVLKTDSEPEKDASVTAEPTTEPTAEPEAAVTPDITPQIIYVTPEPEVQVTPTPILVYVTPAPDSQSNADPTPQVIYVYEDQENG